ncbi:MAG TPA: carboxypeptidase-like regulatory domain-containing protein, partial [Terriglobia bacterium]|nr:carboxypeptidase-like regulatory domain-containing protein [Terriglobia bacterium]
AGGFVRSEYGQKRMNGAGLPIAISPNQPPADANIGLTQTGSISGRVTDVNGQPIVLADVFALKAAYQEGRRTFVQSLSAKTDDRGEYRIFWMTPGIYYVDVIIPDGTNAFNLIMNADGLDTQASMNANRSIVRDVLSRPIGTGAAANEAHVPVYYPTTTDPLQARGVEVRPGSDIRGLDITGIRVLTRTLRGTVFNGVTRQLPTSTFPAQVRLLSTDPAQPAVPGTVDQTTGRFEVPRVVPGNYFLFGMMRQNAVPNAQPAEVLWASVPLEVRDRDLLDLSLGTLPGIAIQGRVALEDKSSGPPPSLAGIFIGMRPDPLIAQGAPSPGTQTSADGTFSTPPINPGKFRVYVIPMLAPNNPGLLGGLPPGPPALKELNPYVKSIKADGVEVVDTGVTLAAGMSAVNLEITLGTNAGAVSGRVLTDKNEPADGAVVGLIPATPSARGFRMDMYKSTSSDARGQFQFQGLPPGEYKVFAWEDIDRNALVDLDYMHQFEGSGKVVRVNEGERPAVEVSLIPASR